MADGHTRRHGHGEKHQGYYQRHILSWWWWISLILSDASCHLAYSSYMLIFQLLAWDVTAWGWSISDAWHGFKQLEPVGRWNVPRRTAIAEDLPTTWCARWFANTKSPPAVRSQGAPLLLVVTAFCWAGTTGVSIEGTQQKTSHKPYGNPMNPGDISRRTFEALWCQTPVPCSDFFRVRVNWLKYQKIGFFLDLWWYLDRSPTRFVFFFMRAFIESSLFKLVVDWNSCNLF